MLFRKAASIGTSSLDYLFIYHCMWKEGRGKWGMEAGLKVEWWRGSEKHLFVTEMVIKKKQVTVFCRNRCEQNSTASIYYGSDKQVGYLYGFWLLVLRNMQAGAERINRSSNHNQWRHSRWYTSELFLKKMAQKFWILSFRKTLSIREGTMKDTK